MAISSHFDFVVVGGGTAGLVVAARLSEDPSVQVAIVEAGDLQLENPDINIPGEWTSLLGKEFDWAFNSVPQPGLGGRKISQPAGRVVGGSSAINGMAFITPSKATIDAWGTLGNKGWSWDVIQPYYRKFHTLAIPDEAHKKHMGLDFLDGSAGDSGPIQAYYCTPLSDPLAPAWNAAFKQLGFAPKCDPASGVGIGGFSCPSSVDIKSKERSYAAPAYWKPASSRPNLHLVTGAVVERVLLSEQNTKMAASGVEVLIGGEKTIMLARREIILAAGALQSPKLLELSGIGNSTILNKHGIKTIIPNDGVGENHQDHLMTGISYEVKDNVQTLDALRGRDPEALKAAREAYFRYKEGPLAWGGFHNFSYMPIVDPDTESSTDSLPFSREIAAHPSALDTGDNTGLARQYDFLRSVLQSRTEGSGGIYMAPRGANYGVSEKASDYANTSLPGKYINIGLSLLYPFSRGCVHISSADPHAKPIIDPRYLSNPLDVETCASHLMFIEKIATTEPLASYLKPNGRRNSPHARADTREHAAEWAKKSMLSNWHSCGTCAMMPQDLGGVVNERLIVHGTSNLRVVDASIMPIIPRGNIQSSVYMVAERAADIIKEDHVLAR